MSPVRSFSGFAEITFTAALLWTLVCLGVLRSSGAQSATGQLDDQTFPAVQMVGSVASGATSTFQGCSDTGATLSNLTLWANAQFIRGLTATLTDGRNASYGCVDLSTTRTDTCANNTNVRSTSFVFQPGEAVTNLTLWRGYNLERQPDQRAGAISISTSKGRFFQFGMTDPWVDSMNAQLGSGIPCGVAVRAGADIDALGLVFLNPVFSSTLRNVTYQGFPNQQGAPAYSSPAVESNVSNVILSSQTYNNTGRQTGLVASFASDEPVDTHLSWSTAPGLDSYLTSTVVALVPDIQNSSAQSSSGGWYTGQSGVHNRTESSAQVMSWNYTINVGAGGVSEATVRTTQGTVMTPFQAQLVVVLGSNGTTLRLPLSGTFEGLRSSPLSVSVTELVPARQAEASEASAKSTSSSSSGNSTTVAWVAGVLIGLLAGIILGALLTYGFVRFRRRRQQRLCSCSQKLPKDFYVSDGDESKAGGTKGESDNVKRKSPGSARAMSHGAGRSVQRTANFDTQVDPVMGVPVRNSDSSAGERSMIPYATFRRWRLESLRNALGSDKQHEDAAVAAADKTDASRPKATKPAEGTAVSDTLPAARTDLDTAREPDGEEDDKVDFPASGSDSKGQLRSSGAGQSPSKSRRLKDRVAALMARRREASSTRVSVSEAWPGDNIAPDVPHEIVVFRANDRSKQPASPQPSVQQDPAEASTSSSLPI